MYTLNFRGNSNAHYYWELQFDNGTTNDTALRIDGSSTAHENTSHNHAHCITALSATDTVANQQATVRVKNAGGDTANDSGDGDHEQTLVVMVI